MNPAKPTDELFYIVESLRPLAVLVSSIDLDPANARLHPADNLSALRGSLRTFGQRKPVVVNRRTNTVEAGNGTLTAARELGWTHIAAVFVDDDPNTAAGFAVSDNRSAELATWDQAALDSLLNAVETEDPDLQRMLEALTAEQAEAEPSGEKEPPGENGFEYSQQFAVIVQCETEAEQRRIYEKLSAEGLQCKVVVT